MQPACSGWVFDKLLLPLAGRSQDPWSPAGSCTCQMPSPS